MNKPHETAWREWIREQQAIAQNGLTYARDPYDVERDTSVRDVAAEMIAAGSGAEVSAVQELLGRYTGYARQKIDVRRVVFQDEKILLVRERSDGRRTLISRAEKPQRNAEERR
jgi:hypothetical protein